MDLAGWLDRSLNTISRKDVEQCFNRLTAEIGWVGANSALTMLGALYRRQCVDVEGLHNPVAQWRAAGGRLHPQRRRRIAPPAEVLPRWHRGIEKGVKSPVARDALRCGLYTGMRFSEVIELRWDRVDLDAMTLTVEETKTGEPLVIPVVRQLAAILERRLGERGEFPEHSHGWVFPSATSSSGRIMTLQQLNARIGEEGGAKFWFHALRNCFITVADRELMLPTSLTKRLVNHARPQDVPIAMRPMLDRLRFSWSYETEPEPHCNGRRIPVPRGKVLGGTSSINAMIYARGHPLDYDQWRQKGLPGWGYGEVLPYFRRSERSWRGETEYHGGSGPLRVTPSRI